MRERRGHDLFGFPIGLPVRFEDATIDHVDIIEEARRKVGPLQPAVERMVRSTRTGRYFGVPDFWTPCPTIYRHDLWAATGMTPSTWDDVRRAGPALKAAGHPIGIGLAAEGDSQLTLTSLLFSYGGSIQDEQGNVTIGRPESVEAVKVAVDIYRTGMTPEVLTWMEVHSDNRALVAGQASLIVDPLSGVRAAEQQKPDLAPLLALAPTPAGPAGRIGAGVQHLLLRVELLRAALPGRAVPRRPRDPITGRRSCTPSSDLPSFPGAIGDIGGLLARRPRRTEGQVLGPGRRRPLVHQRRPSRPRQRRHRGSRQRLHRPKMFGAAVRGELSPQESVRQTEAQVKQIFAKWRERGKI